MEEKLNGIVLSGVSFGENDKILNIFTLEKGTVSAIIKGVKKAGAKLKFASEPFCFAEFVFSVRGERRTVIGASLTDSFYPLRTDIVKFYCGGAVLEYVKRFVPENVVSVDLFLLAVETLKALAYGACAPTLPLVKFLSEALKLSGYALDFSGCARCKVVPEGRVFFDYSSGAFYCEKCFDGAGREINAETFFALKKTADGECVSVKESVAALKLLDFYISVKPEENLKALKELLKICN